MTPHALLEFEILKYLRFASIYPKLSRNDQSKLKLAAKKLSSFQKETGHCLRFILKSYAYFYVEIFKQTSLAGVYLKLEDYMERIRQTTYLYLVTDADVDLALEVENCWIGMNKLTIDDIPFKVRHFLAQKNIKIGDNTKFLYTRNFILFARVAGFINRNRLNYPELHGIREFFLHQPVISGPRSIRIEEFYNPERTLEWYYTRVYGMCAQENRFKSFVDLLVISKEELATFQKSDMWCASATADQIERELKLRASV